MNILVSVPKGEIFDSFLCPQTIDLLNQLGTVHYNDLKHNFTSEELRTAIRNMDFVFSAWGTPRFDEFVLENANRLKLIGYCGGSVGGLYSKKIYECGISLCSANKLFAESVAEGTVAYMLCGLRQISQLDYRMKSGELIESGSLENGLIGKTVGLVSFGEITKNVIRMLKPFRCNIKLFSTKKNHDLARELGFEYMGLEELFASCDVISLHTALNANTVGMITKDLLDTIKDGALFINTARGALVDEAALTKALASERFSAVLDVFSEEPLCADHQLRRLSNATLLPHRAGPSFDRRADIGLEMAKEIQRFLENKPLLHKIDETYAKKMTTS